MRAQKNKTTPATHADEILRSINVEQIEYYPKGSESETNLKKKWIIIDFWSQFCSACIESFPDLNSLQKKYSDSIQIILVGIPYKDMKIKTIFEKCRNELNLNLPIIYDQAASQKWGIHGVPDLYIYDPKGNFRGRSTTISDKNIQDLLSGKKPHLYQDGETIKKIKSSYDFSKPFLVEKNGGRETDFFYRSLFSKWNPDQPGIGIRRSTGKFEVFGRSIQELYTIAYFGYNYWHPELSNAYSSAYPEPILLIKDSTLWKSEDGTAHLFNYSVCHPSIKEDKRNLKRLSADSLIMELMQKDLCAAFPYEATIEKKRMPCLSITNIGGSMTGKSNNQDTSAIPDFSIHLNNEPVAALIKVLYSSKNAPRLPIIDKTGGNKNINIHIDNVYFKQIISSLEESGFKIISDSISINTLIIRDK